MSRYYSNEDREKAIETRINERREAAALFPEVVKVIKQFDGKVYNKRFLDAIEAGNDKRDDAHKLRAYKDSYGNIEIYRQGRDYNNGAYIFCVNIRNEPERFRISAADWIEKAAATRENNLKEAAELERMKEAAPAIREQLAQLDKLIDGILAPIDYTMRELFDLRIKTYNARH